MGVPPSHWWGPVFFLIPAVTGYTILARAGHDVRLRLEPPEHLRHAGRLRVVALPAAHHREGITRAVSGTRLAPAPRRPSFRRPPPSGSRPYSETLASARLGRVVAHHLR